MPRRNRNKNFNNRNFNNNFHNGGGVNNHKWSNNQNRYNNNSKKIYLKPSKLEALEQDYELNNPQTSSSYNHNQNNRNFDSNRKNKKENHRRVVQNLDKMGLVKSTQPKLSIGDNDREIKKALLESKAHCKLNHIPDDVFQMIVSYVQNYFTCYDTNREGLLKAYNHKVMFSLSLNMSNHAAYRAFKFDDQLLRENRNLKRLIGNEGYHDDKRFRLLHQGYIETVNFLSKLPPTEHDPRSFKLDNCFFSPNMISFSLTGVYKEGKPTDKVRPFRSFHRVFVCVPNAETQMNIINEQCIITNITNEQYKAYFQSEIQKKNESNQEETSQQQQLHQPTSSNPSQINTLNEKEIMLQQFSAESRLNLEWSKYCLEHAGWNYEEAAKAFMQHKDNIPKDAFLS